MITTDSDDRKEIPVYSGFMNYFPDAIAEVARLSQVGNDKHNPGQPLHWDRDKSNDHSDCLMRHQIEYYKMDTDGFHHAVKVAWRAMAQLQVLLEGNEMASALDVGKSAIQGAKEAARIAVEARQEADEELEVDEAWDEYRETYKAFRVLQKEARGKIDELDKDSKTS